MMGAMMPCDPDGAKAPPLAILAVHLASDASGYATGEQFLIDGGYTKF